MQRERERERENERTIFFINEGNGLSTIPFYIQSSGKNKQTTTSKTIEDKIIINSKIILTIERERE